MRLDSFGLAGPPTSKKERKEKKRVEEEEEQQQSWSSSSSSTSFVEYRSYTSSRSFHGSSRDCVVDGNVPVARHRHNETRHHDWHGPNEETGTATAFRVSHDSASRGVDHEEKDDNDGDVDTSCARTRIHRIVCPSPRRRAPRSARRARRRDGPDVAASAVSFVDELAHTAYSDVRDNDDDDDDDDDEDDHVDDKERTRCEQKRIHSGSEQALDEHEDNVRVSVPGDLRDVHVHEDANKNVPREDYIRTEVDAISRYVLKSDERLLSSSSFDKRKDHDCERERIGRETVDRKLDGQRRRKKGECNERRRSDNTAWFQKPITRRKGGEGGEGGTGYKPRTRRNYYYTTILLLFVLYLLAWPLLCSTSPTGHAFARNPITDPKNPVQRSKPKQLDTSFSSSTVIVHQDQQTQKYDQGKNHNIDDSERHRHHQQQQHQHQQQQQHQEQQSQQQQQQQEQQLQQQQQRSDQLSCNQQQQQREKQQLQQQQQQQQQKEEKDNWEQLDQENEESKCHPYNKYTWEVNQINPWLSACDLAGPEPADLLGSCSLSQVSTYCPMSCKDVARMSHSRLKDSFHEVIDAATTKMTRTKTRTKDENENRNGDRAGGAYRTAEEREGTENEGDKGVGVRTVPEQCLFYLEESHKGEICHEDFGRSSARSFSTLRENRYWFMSGLRLRHCCDHAVVNALASGIGGPLEDVLNGGDKCIDALDKLLLVDAMAARLHCEFEEVIGRFDCRQTYSVVHTCSHCKDAYRKWVCSTLVPYFAHGPTVAGTPTGQDNWTGTRLRPCRSFCYKVEQRCPYLVPTDRAPALSTQYAGEPTFLCQDPEIPEAGEQAAKSVHSNSGECCYHLCAEDAYGSGICTNCTKPWEHGRIKDPPTAPQCVIRPPKPTGLSQSLYQTTTDVSLVADSSSIITEEPFCGQGRIGSIMKRSSSGRSSSGRSSSPIVHQLLWLCSILISFPANALQYNPMFWSISGFLRLIGSGLRRILNDLRIFFDPHSAGFYRFAVEQCLLFVLRMPRRAVMKCRRRGWWWWRSWRRTSSRHFRWKPLPREERCPGVRFRRSTYIFDENTTVPGSCRMTLLKHCLRRLLVFPHRLMRTFCWFAVATLSKISERITRSRRSRRRYQGKPRRSDIMSWRSVLRDALISIFELFLKFVVKCRCREWWSSWRKCGTTDRRNTELIRRKNVRRARQRSGRRRGLVVLENGRHEFGQVDVQEGPIVGCPSSLFPDVQDRTDYFLSRYPRELSFAVPASISNSAQGRSKQDSIKDRHRAKGFQYQAEEHGPISTTIRFRRAKEGKEMKDNKATNIKQRTSRIN